MKAFLISPVRGKDQAYQKEIRAQVEKLESEDYQVHWPYRDTRQDTTELAICTQNFEAIKAAEVVFIIWDGNSKGCIFDLGSAFALGKTILPVKGFFPEPVTDHKALSNLVHQLKEAM